MNRKPFIILGLVLGLFGFGIIINPDIYHSAFQYQFNFTDIKWPFGGGLIILGILFIRSSFRKKTIEAEKRENDDKKIL